MVIPVLLVCLGLNFLFTEKGIKAHGYVCDVTDEPAVQAMVATIEKEVGTIDILVNNAGIIRRVPMHEMEAADFRRVIDIDLNAPFIVSKAVLPAMMKKRKQILALWLRK